MTSEADVNRQAGDDQIQVDETRQHRGVHEQLARELNRALGEVMMLVPQGDGHDTGCLMHSIHDDVYENPEPDDNPPQPRVCDCHVEPVHRARRALARAQALLSESQ